MRTLDDSDGVGECEEGVKCEARKTSSETFSLDGAMSIKQLSVYLVSLCAAKTSVFDQRRETVCRVNR